MIKLIKQKDRQALTEFKAGVRKEFPRADFILFGSKSRGEDMETSDLDILVLLDESITINLEKKIFDLGFEAGLSYDVVFGIVVEEKAFWNSNLSRAMPFYQNVMREGRKL